MKKVLLFLLAIMFLNRPTSPQDGEEKWFLNETNVSFLETDAGCESTSPGWKGKWDEEGQVWKWIAGDWRTTKICPTGQCGCSDPVIVDLLIPKCGDKQLFFGQLREYTQSGDIRIDRYVWVGIFNCQTNSWMETSGDWVPLRIGSITL